MENIVAVVYTTVNNMKNARKIARALVEEKLVACVNILPKVESVYRWKGDIESGREYVLIAKTTDKQVKKTIQRIKELHTYELPDIIVLPIIGGLKEYLNYLVDETA
jgi:periplasmic divalent cation tolerance protein